jgi:hypothetical protein
MPSIDINFMTALQDDYTKYTCFIETGTYYGQTCTALEPYFNKVYTIEISELYHTKAKNTYNGNKINFILGDSSKVFENLLPTIQEKTIFFLDGHWSCCDTGKGDKEVPLIEEIAHINNLFKNDAILIIDDYRLFGKSQKTGYDVDWGDISKGKILEILSSRIKSVYHLDSSWAKDDRLIIHISAI